MRSYKKAKGGIGDWTRRLTEILNTEIIEELRAWEVNGFMGGRAIGRHAGEATIRCEEMGLWAIVYTRCMSYGRNWYTRSYT